MSECNWEEYRRDIFYSEIFKCMMENERNVNGESETGGGTTPSDAVIAEIRKIRSHEANFRTKSLIDLTSCRERQLDRRRTKSLTDLTCQRADIVNWRVVRQNSCWTTNANVNEAGRRVVNLLMLNAWRRRREDHEEARAAVERLTNEVSSLKMQVYVLRKLLHHKRARATLASKELEKYLAKLEKCGEENKLMLKEKESLECEIKDLQDVVADLQRKCKNLENDLVTANFESENWEERLKKERKELKAVKEENATLRKEVSSKKNELDYQSQCLQELNCTILRHRQYLQRHVFLLNEAMEQIQSEKEKLKLSDVTKTKMEEIIAEKNQEIKELKEEFGAMEEKCRAQDEKNGELRKLISEKTKELATANDKLMELRRSDKFWGKKMVKIASLCTRIPMACFYTVATLVVPQPWHRFL